LTAQRVANHLNIGWPDRRWSYSIGPQLADDWTPRGHSPRASTRRQSNSFCASISSRFRLNPGWHLIFLIEAAYENGGYEDTDDRVDPMPPLAPEDSEWAAGVLRDAHRR
jgi:hypothetical protein